MQTDLTALIERVESGDGPDFELEREIGFALGIWKRVRIGERDMLEAGNEIFLDHPGAIYPALLESLDAVLSLIGAKLPGWSWSVRHEQSAPVTESWVWEDSPEGWTARGEIDGRQPARALLAAALRAIQESRSHDGR